ncbi:Tuberous sclerosis 2-like protein [Pichia californica]|uniref:Tuberous sclerosis 2-like protein n=1 Tax=Pichia californica TaxID=460514 RepID=A0A9P6WJL4_9ASCO|nr:Tuberous sclerosis 2-like protein [[Candida] californica]KAG0688341.1 Tuberous sclerosis 2-like protein [[Candida] californica]
MGSSVGEHDSNTTNYRTSSVGRVIRSISQAFGITNPQFDAQQIVSYVGDNFVINDNKLIEILEDGSSSEKLNALKFLKNQIVNISSEKRLVLWEIVKSKINLKKESPIRTEVLQLFCELLKFNDTPTFKGLRFYIDICENINIAGIDKDMKLFLMCLHSLLNFSDIDSFEKYPDYPLNDFLLKLYNQILNYNSAELEVLIISIIAQSISINNHLFTSDELQNLFDNIIKISLKTVNIIFIEAFLDFFKSFLQTGYKYDNNIYSIMSILGCAYGLELTETLDKCELIMDILLSKDESHQIPFILCDVVIGKFDNKYSHRTGNRPIIGCLRFISYILKYIKLNTDAGITVTLFFYHHLDYLFQSLILLSKSSDNIILIEILKFIDEVLEKPYSMNGYYKCFIERNDFWELLNLLNWSNGNSSSSHQVVITELFNKLQNFELNNFYISKLIAYLETNYEILNSYNITYVLNYYSKTKMCVCGALYWKANCRNIVEKYYRTAPSDVLTVLKEAFLYCIPLKIDQPSLDFYIDLIFYDCIIGLDFQFDDEILDPITDVLLKLDDKIFENIIINYQLEIKTCKDQNVRMMCKVLIISTVKGTSISNISNKMSLLINSIISIAYYTDSVKNSSIYIFCILLLTRIRSITKGSKKLYYVAKFRNDEAKTSSMISSKYIDEVTGETIEDDFKIIDEKINEIFEDEFRDYPFEIKINNFFNNIRTNLFNANIDGNSLLELYNKILGNTEDWKHYFIILKNLRNQLLNSELFDNDCYSNIIKIVRLFTQQMQFIYTFKFNTPKWIEVKHIRISIVEVLYGLFPYKNIIPLIDGESLFRSIVLDFHFCEITRISYLNFLNSCLFEMPELMKHFILPILKIINDDISKPQTLFSNLAFLNNLLETISLNYYELKEKELKLVPCILNEILNYDIESTNNNFNEIECSKILAKLIKIKIEKENFKTSLTNLKSKVKFININNKDKDLFENLFKNIINEFETDKLVKYIVNDFNIETLKIRSSHDLYDNNQEENNDNLINVIFSEEGVEYDNTEDYLTKKIIVTSIEDNDEYFNISNYGFNYINLRGVVIQRINIVKFIKVVIELCLISTVKKN